MHASTSPRLPSPRRLVLLALGFCLAACLGPAAGAMEVSGNGVPIPNGSVAPSLDNHTDFGPAASGDPAKIHTFTVHNPSGDTLNLTGIPLVEITGTHAADFAVTAAPAAAIPAGGTTTFQIGFSPAALGPRTATVTIHSDSAGDPTYTFAIRGDGKQRSVLYPFDWDPLDTDPQGRFLHDFSYAGYHAGQEAIPDAPPGPVVDATQAPYNADPTGATDSTEAIQAALDAVGQSGGGVVYLPPGTYLISLPDDGPNWALRIRYPRTILRGAGRDQTFLENTSTFVRGANIILVRPDTGSVFTALGGTTRQLVADAEDRTHVLALDSVAGLAVGDRVVIRSDWTQGFIDEHGMQAYWTPASGRTGPFFFRRVVAIDPATRTVTIDAPTRYPLKTRDNSRLYLTAPFLREVGIEDLAIGNRQHPAPGWSLYSNGSNGWGDNDYTDEGKPANDVHGSHFVHFYHVWDGWMRRVDTYRPADNPDNIHILSNIAKISASRFVTFADCVVGYSQYNGGGGNGYGLAFQDANDCLLTACEVIRTRHNYDFKCAGANGNVVHRSIGRAPRLASDFHMYLSIANLFDTMLMDGDFLESRFRPYGAGDNLHGHAGTQNVFWNTYGTNARGDRKAVDSRQYGHGYVIGTSGPSYRAIVTPVVDGGIDTSPEDWTEFINTGDRLYPESLYEDQFARRAAFLPRVESGPVESTHNSARLHATLSNQDARATLFWGQVDGGKMPEAWQNRIELGPAAVGPLAAELYGLPQNTTYFFRWLVRNNQGQDWADATETFTTRIFAENELPVRSGLLLHLDAGELAGYGNGDPVPLWPDISGRGHDGEPVGANGIPVYAANAIGGHPAVRFDGIGNNLVVGDLRQETGGYEFFMVAAGPSAAGGSWQRLVSSWNGTDENDYSGSSWQLSRPNTGGVPDLFEPRIFRQNATADRTLKNLTFAANSTNPAGSNLDGDIAEILVFDRSLATTERNKVGAYLANKYNLLPTTYVHDGTATIRALTVSDLSASSAVVHGMLDSSGNSPAEIRLYLGIADGGATAANWPLMFVLATGQSGQAIPLSMALPGLRSDLTYFVRFAASNAAGVTFSQEVLSFRTAPPDISVADCAAYRGGDNPTAAFPLNLSYPWGAELTIEYATADGTAQAGRDYESRAGTVVIPAEATSATVHVPILPGVPPGPSRQFTLSILDADEANLAKDTGIATIHGAFADYYVDPAGSDANPGTIEAPFATIEQARDTVADLYRLGVQPTGGVTVWLRGGRHEINETILFDGRHAGTAADPIAYRGYPGEEVRLSGGHRLQAEWFAPVTDDDPVWDRLDPAAQGQVVQIDLAAHGITDFGTLRRRGMSKAGVLGALELFVDRQPQQLARWPNADQFNKTVAAPSNTEFTYSGNRPDRWSEAEEIWTHGYWYHMWADEQIPVADIDTATRTVTLDGEEHNYGIRAGQPYYFFNLLEELDLPGEWYLNRDTGILYFWPDAPLGESEIEISLFESALLRVNGASHLRFVDLVLECTRGELVQISAGTDNRIEQSILRNSGTNAAAVAGTDNGLDDCLVHHTGSGGVRLSGGDRVNLIDARNFVTNCEIHHFGRWVWTYAPAVNASGCGNIIEQNHIWHGPHSAIHFSGNRMSVKYNNVHDACRFASDMGAIYTGRDWGARGNEISYNFVHHIQQHSSFADPHGTHGIYLDDMVSGVTVHGNILYQISHYGIQHGGGRDSILTNNVFKDCGYGVRADARGIDWAHPNVNARAQDSWDLLHKLRLLDYQSDIWATAYPECAAIPNDYTEAYTIANGWVTPGGSILERNIYCNIPEGFQYARNNAFIYYASIANNVQICDSLFVDEANLNLTLHPDNPAFLIPGFENIPFGDIGPQRRIQLRGNGIDIANGHTTPDPADHTDFGGAALGDPAKVHTFAVHNPGNARLSLTGTPLVEISGPDAADFAVVAEPEDGIPAGDSTTFQIGFVPGALGLRTATVTIRCNVIDETIYTFAIQGTGKERSDLYPVAWNPLDTDPEGRFLHDFGYAGYHAGQEPIPDSPPGPVVDVTQAPYHADPTGTADSTAAIQQALDEVGQSGGGVVYLPPGTYLISPPDGGPDWALRIRHDRTVLRGAGRDQTFLENTSTVVRNANIVLVQPDTGSVFDPLPGTTRLLVADADNRASILELDSVDGLAVGDRVVIHSDWTQEFIDEHGMTDHWTPSPDRTGTLFFRRIVAIDPAAGTVTLDTPTRYPLKTRDNSRLHRTEPFLREVGIEDLAIGNRQHPTPGWAEGINGWADDDYTVEGTPAHDVHGSHFIHFQHVWDGWMRRVDSYRPDGNPDDIHILSNVAKISASRFVTFADCVVGKTQYNGGGGNGYGLAFQDANDCLMTRCEVIGTRHNYGVGNAGANGNVVHRSTGRHSRLASGFHSQLSIGNLFDTMLMDGDFLESRVQSWDAGNNQHGHAGTQNVFWNTYGTDARPDGVAVDSRQYGHGYVVGTSGPSHLVILDPVDHDVDTSPIDRSEFIGNGDRLYPESLYEDQLARRAALRPRVESGPAEPTHRTAILHATLANHEAQAILFWGESDGGTMPEAWDNRVELGAAAIGPMVAELDDLWPVTTYFYRWLVWNEQGQDWADATGSFTTLLGPMIFSDGVTLNTTSSGIFQAELLLADAHVTLHWGTTDGGTDPHAWSHAAGPAPQAIGTFTLDVDNLAPVATLHYRWRAVANGAESWSPATETIDTTPTLTVADIEVQEGDGTATFTVVLTPPSTLETNVGVATEDGTAQAGLDYAALGRTVVVPAGQPSVEVEVAILDDLAVDIYRKDFRLALANPVNATIGTPVATCTILDDDLPTLPVTDGLVLHLDASALAGVLADGEASPVWPDSSGLGNHAATDAGSPVWHEQALNGRPAFAFDGLSATFLSPAIRAETGPVTVFAVSEKDTDEGDDWQRLAASHSGGPDDHTPPNWSLDPVRGEGGAPLSYPVAVASLREADGHAIGPVRLARQATAADGWYAGKIGDVLVYDRQLSEAEQALVTSWLEAKYAVAGFTVAPAISLRGNGLPIANGDDTPNVADGTDFGETTAATQVFHIHNLGTDELTIASVTEDSDHFSVSEPPAATSLAPGGATPFTIAYDPNSLGVHTATVTILGNDAPYTFAIQGERPGPQLQVKLGETILASENLLDFAGLDLAAPAATRTLTVTNLGNRDLVLVSATLDEAGTFAVGGFAPDTVVAPAAATTFDILFDPAANGPHAATLEIVTNDVFQSPFFLDLQGVGTTAPLALPASDPTTTGFTANWNPVANADGYRLDVATDDTFATLVEGYDNRDVGNTNSLTLADLPVGSHCHYRVRAVFGTAASLDSNPIRGDRMPTAPGPFTVPLAGQVLQGGSQLEPAWGAATDADGDAIGYALEFHDGNQWTAIPADQPHTLPGGIETQVSYRVRAEAGGLVSPWTESAAVQLDGIPPTVLSVAVPPAALYRLGNELVFTVETSEPVALTGTPTLGILLDTGPVTASYDPGTSQPTQLVFRHVVQPDDRAADGIQVDALDLATATIRDAAGNDLDPVLQGVGDTSQIRIEAESLLLHVDASHGNDANDGLAWGQALQSLATALDLAVPGDEIWVRAGIHVPGNERTDAFALKSGVAVYGGFVGTETLRAERDIAANPTVLSGDIGLPGDPADNSLQVVRNPAGIDETAILDGFIITGGNADGGEPGGAMLNLGASPTIRNCHFHGNRGTAVANLDGAAPRFDACTFSANLDGPAVLNQASAPLFVNGTFTANPGGAVLNAAASPATFVHCTFSGNDGGALHNTSELEPTLLNSIFHDNGGEHGITGTIADGNIQFSLVQGGGYGDATCLDGDPQLGPLADNGGPVPTMSLGHFSAALAAASGGTLTGARGEARPFGLAGDLGAYEATLPLLIASEPAPAASGVALDTGLSITFQCDVTPVADTNLFLRIVGGDLVETIPATQATMDGQTATFAFAAPLDYDTQYCIQIEAGAFTGSGGNPAIADETTLAFTTVEPPIYRVRFLADGTPNAQFDGETSQDVALGNDAEPVEALPPVGHHFVKWTLDGADYSTDNPLTVPAVTADMDLVAHFAPNSYTWTFRPGEHGTIIDGEPNVVLTVTFGEPAPDAPVVLPDAGYSFSGWSTEIPATVGVENQEFTAQYEPIPYTLTVHHGSGSGEYFVGDLVTATAAERRGRVFTGWTVDPPEFADRIANAAQPTTDFAMPAQNATLTATYAFTDPAWTGRIFVSGQGRTHLAFGMHDAASDGWEEGLDTLSPFPGAGEARFVSDDLALAYEVEYRETGDTADFLLVAHAGPDQPLVLTWDIAELPPGTFLTIYETSPEAPWIPLGDTARDMARTAAATVPAGEIRHYVLHYGDRLVHDFAFAQGWNLFSLPIEPADPAATAILGDELGENVLAWGEDGHAEADILVPTVGYWVYAAQATNLLVRGLPVVQQNLVLSQGWNLVGSAQPHPVPDDTRIRGIVWRWDPDRMQYKASDTMLPGRGYWLTATEDADIPLANP